jgi:hypothetical protein
VSVQTFVVLIAIVPVAVSVVGLTALCLDLFAPLKLIVPEFRHCAEAKPIRVARDRAEQRKAA